MGDNEILQHLLELEKEASALVNEAQTEADRRISEAEKQNRVRYDDIYNREVKALEASFAENIASVRENYRKLLKDYEENQKTISLKLVSSNWEAFSSLAEKYLLESVTKSRES